MNLKKCNIIDNEFRQIPIEGLELYFCNRQGDIFSKSKKQGILSPRMDRDGYLIITFSCNKKRLDMKVHRVVATTFIGLCPKDYVCNHINSIKNDNSVSNLEWVSQKNNYHHSKSLKNENNYNPIKWTGEKHGLTKLSDKQVLIIRKNYKLKKETYKLLSIKYQVSKSCIKRILSNQTYKHILGKNE